jgi:signal transduction histidine kinase
MDFRRERAEMPQGSTGGRRQWLGRPFLHSLKTKFIAALILLVGVVLGLSAWWGLRLHAGHMIQATEDKVRALADAIDGGIQVAMREGHTTEVQRILQAIARDPDIEQIVILDDGGTIRQASKPALIGRSVDRERLSRYLTRADSTVIGRYENGQLIQSVVKKIRNRLECRPCHGTAAEALGTLQLDMSFHQTQIEIAAMERGAVWTVLLTGLALATGGGLLMTRLVDRRVTHLAHAMARVEAGDLSTSAVSGAPDELGRLADGFNAMVVRLRAARDEIEVYHREKLARAERLATLGEVAASLAHEIKNPLAGIAGAVGVMAEDLPSTDPRKEIMDEILSQIRRLNKTVQDLLTFARPATPSLESCDVHRVIDRVLLLLAEDPTAKQIRVVRNYHPTLPRVEADDKQLGQVFLNLLLNAAQAMHGSGQISITTRVQETDGAGEAPSATAGEPMVEVSLTDTGPGIPAGILSELFTPFFTTKPRGTGLGLAISRRIIEDHGGWIRAESPPQQGATFRIGLRADVAGPGDRGSA